MHLLQEAHNNGLVTHGAPSNKTSCIYFLLGEKGFIDDHHTARTTKLHTIELLLNNKPKQISDLVADLGPCFLSKASFFENLLLGCIRRKPVQRPKVLRRRH